MKTRLTNHISGKGIILVLILAVVSIEAVRDSFGTLSIVEGSSMYPTFRPNDVVQAKVSHAESQRGDVVIITDNRGGRAIKRVLGLPGETVTIYRGFIYIGGQRLREPYLPRYTYTFNSNQEDERAVVWRLNSSQYFVLGDNRLESYDSRHYGPVERRQINRVVALPENAARPGFCEVVLSENGKAVRAKYNRPSGNWPRGNHHASNAKT